MPYIDIKIYDEPTMQKINIKSIFIAEPYTKLPKHVTEIVMHGTYKGEIHTVPDTLKILNLTYGHKAKDLPLTLHKLRLGETYIAGNIPTSIHTLTFGHLFNNVAIPYFPNQLHTLELNDTYNQELNNLPASLHTLIN